MAGGHREAKLLTSGQVGSRVRERDGESGAGDQI